MKLKFSNRSSFYFFASLHLCAFALSFIGCFRQQTRFSFMQWQPDAKRRATTDVAFQLNPAVVRADNALHDHQSEAAAFFLRRVKRLENPVDLLLRNAAARVRHAQIGRASCRERGSIS